MKVNNGRDKVSNRQDIILQRMIMIEQQPTNKIEQQPSSKQLSCARAACDYLVLYQVQCTVTVRAVCSLLTVVLDVFAHYFTIHNM